MRTFHHAFRHNDFAVSAEIYLRPETDADALRQQADILRDSVDGILLTDNQYGQVHLSTLAAASILLAMGVDPIVQLASRSRNRTALVSDLLGAAALGVTSLLLAAGERPPKGVQPRPKPVLDLTAIELVRTAKTVCADERLPQRPNFLIGAPVTAVSPGPRWRPAKLKEKIDAGAQFVQTHLSMDVELLRNYLRRLVGDRLIHKTGVIVSLAVLESADDARWLVENRPNVRIPDAVVKRLERAADPAAEGIAVCAEIIGELRETPGVRGVSIMATRHLACIPRALSAAGLQLATE
ncbi:MAG: methylenetetrahydrofolate reductase [Woeseiaceae bacterium]|nr:methylenetetrahydrofolate reductase [Woeseiaceae bacterium]